MAIAAGGNHERIQIKPEAPVTGFVDGAWWPRSRDLPAELPALLTALSERLSPVERISYHLEDWDPPERKVYLGGQIVRLGGFRSQRPHTVDVIANRRRLTLLVIPPDTAEPIARKAISTAAQSGDSATIQDLLGRTPPTRPADQTINTIHLQRGKT